LGANGMMTRRRETGFKVGAAAAYGGGLRRIDWLIGPADNLPPSARHYGLPVVGGHAPAVWRQDAQRCVTGWGCHKSFTFISAGCLVDGKDCKPKHFASKNIALRRSQSRPKHCLGETYADHFYSPLGCNAGPSLIAIYLVVRGQSAK
jgi:hypothetical protein